MSEDREIAAKDSMLISQKVKINNVGSGRAEFLESRI